MAGWDSHAPNPNDVKFRRNKSLTKDEIGAFWKSKKEKEEEHLRDIFLLSPRTQEKIIFEEDAERSESASNVAEVMSTLENELQSETSLDKNGWWISSNSAFVNEPLVIAVEGTAERLDSKYPVCNMFKLFVCAVCQAEIKPGEGISIHAGMIDSRKLRPWDGPFLCTSCREERSYGREKTFWRYTLGGLLQILQGGEESL